MKRILDIFFSVTALIFLLPLFVPICILLKFTGEGEIFFLQNRVGKNGQNIKLFKFATMLKNSPEIGTGTLTVKGDPRVLPVGKFLRKTKINELPQILNIISGEMSIIGPRPQEIRCFNAFPKSSQDTIKKVKPGLSGIGSIVFRNEGSLMESCNEPEKFYDEVIMPYKGKLEEWYVKHNNIKTYFILLLSTIWVICFSKSRIVSKFFNDLPEPPKELLHNLNI